MTRKHMDIAKANGHVSIISSHLEVGAEIPNNHRELRILDNQLEPKIPNRIINDTKATVNVAISRKLDRPITAAKDIKKRLDDSDYHFRGSDKRKIPNKNTMPDKGKIPIVNDSKEKLKRKKNDNDIDAKKSSQRREVLPLPPVSNILSGECSDMFISPSLEETHQEDNVKLISSSPFHETHHIQGRLIDDRNSDRFYDRNSDRFDDLTNNPLSIHGHNVNYGPTRYRSSDPSIASLVPPVGRYIPSTMEKYHSSAIDKYAPRLDVLNPSLPAAEINGINHGLSSVAEINYRLPSIREGGDYRLPSNREIGYMLPSTAVGGSSTIERYSVPLDEMNQYKPWLNNPNLQRPESNPSFLGGLRHDDPMAGFVSGPHISSNQGGWVDD